MTNKIILAVAGTFGIRPQYVHVNNVQLRDNKYIAKGTADLGRNGQISFKCIFEQYGTFVRLKVTR